MNYIFKCILLLCVMVSNTIWAIETSEELSNLQVQLAKLQDDIVGAKIKLELAEADHTQAVTANDEAKIAEALAKVTETKSSLASLEQQLYNIQALISDIESKGALSGAKTQSSNDISDTIEISYSKILLEGWNTFSIPVDKSIQSSNAVLGEHAVIWGYDGLTNKWTKNPASLLPGKGYFIYSTSASKLNFKGISFSTNLDTIIKKSKNWYFLGASKAVESIDYTKYSILKYELQTYIKNPPTINTGDAFWAYRR